MWRARGWYSTRYSIQKVAMLYSLFVENLFQYHIARDLLVHAVCTLQLCSFDVLYSQLYWKMFFFSYFVLHFHIHLSLLCVARCADLRFTMGSVCVFQYKYNVQIVM